jgi:hypothetical protein
MTAIEYLNEVKNRAAKATKGPWAKSEICGEVDAFTIKYKENGTWFRCAKIWEFENNEANADFVAHSRTDIETLVAMLELCTEFIKQVSPYQHPVGVVPNPKGNLNLEANNVLSKLDEIAGQVI